MNRSLMQAIVIVLILGAAGGSQQPTGNSTGGTDGKTLSKQEQKLYKTATPGGRLPRNVKIQLVKVADGFNDPVSLASPSDGSGRLFVVERGGTVRIVQNGKVLEEPFLDISRNVTTSFLEQGLYDIVFHPDYGNNGKFYVHFAELMRNGDSMVVQYSVSKDDPNKADQKSAKVIMQIDQPWANHNGGELAFGPNDGYLYIGSGDGGWEGDPLEAGQDLSTLLGKILRIDVNVTGNQAYAIPAGNPFNQPERLVELFGISEAGFAKIHTQARPEIWAYGLRNPWRFGFDRKTGDLYIADVGQNEWEEIDFQPGDSKGGENYGWDFLMGTHCFPIQMKECPRQQVGVQPIAEYSHKLGCAVIGIGVSRSKQFPSLEGIYFAGDYCSGRIWGIARDKQQEWQVQELLDIATRITGSGEDEQGNLYVTTAELHYGEPQPAQHPPGTLWMIVPADKVPRGALTAPLGEQDGPGHQHGKSSGH